MKVWVTRTEPGSTKTAARLRDLRHTPIVAPLLTVTMLPFEIAAMPTALAFTSGNAVAALAGETTLRALPVFAVGKATARAAQDAGFTDVRAGPSDVAALAVMIAQSLPPGAVVLHPCATEKAGDLAGPLQAVGLTVRSLPVYQTIPAPSDARLIEALDTAEVVLLHSPKAARALSALLTDRATTIRRALCLSEAVALALEGGKIADVAFASLPNDTALLNLL